MDERAIESSAQLKVKPRQWRFLFMLTGDDVTALRFNVGLCFSQNTEYEGVNELRKIEAHSDFEADDFLAPYSN